MRCSDLKDRPRPSALTTASCPRIALASAVPLSTTSPLMSRRRSYPRGIFSGLRTNAVTLWPASSACATSCCPVPPVAPRISSFTSIRFGGRRPPSRIERLRGIRRDLQIGAVMVGVAARVVVAVLGHPLHDLQRALLAADVRQLDVGLPVHGPARLRVVRKQAVGQHRLLRRALDDGPYRARPLFGLSGRRDWIW